MAISITTGKRIDAAIAYLIAIVSIILLIYPIIQFLLTSLKPTRGLFWSIWPESFTLSNYKIVVSSPYFRLALKNSIIIASFATFLVVGIGTLAAYALSSYVFSKREDIAFFILSLYILPLIFVFVFAITDELHQIPVPGRYFDLFDLATDLIAMLLVIFIFKKFLRY